VNGSPGDCFTWSDEVSCRSHEVLCEWSPVDRYDQFTSGPLELPDGGLPDGPIEDAGASCAPSSADAGASCGALELSGPCVPLTETSAVVPNAAGGEIVPGTYELVAWKAYGFSPDEVTPRRQTMVITGSGPSYRAETIGIGADSPRVASSSFAFTVVSNFLAINTTCPSAARAAQDYTAVDRFLLLYEYVIRAAKGGVIISTFERR
jgi:hypothetical protein